MSLSWQKNEGCSMNDYYIKQPFHYQNHETCLHLHHFQLLINLHLVGNTLIIATVYKRKEFRKTVNFFMVNMAASDLVFLLISTPFLLICEAINTLPCKQLVSPTLYERETKASNRLIFNAQYVTPHMMHLTLLPLISRAKIWLTAQLFVSPTT